jgi:hypothetical protein
LCNEKLNVYNFLIRNRYAAVSCTFKRVFLMRLMHSLLSIVLAWGLGAACVAHAAATPVPYPLWTIDAQALAQTQQKIMAVDPAVVPAYQALQDRATKALVTP